MLPRTACGKAEAERVRQMITVALRRKPPAKRAFVGMAGSPLARIKKAVEQPSDDVLRVPKSFDREAPIPFDVWFDRFGQKHGQIDLDCSFQECAFDPQLGRGKNPLENNSLPSHAGGLRPPSSSPMQDLAIVLGTGGKLKTGLVQGGRQLKRRRRTEKTWWVFDPKLLRKFLQAKVEPDRYVAQKAAFVLHYYYLLNKDDEEILLATKEEENAQVKFGGVKEVKQFRQYLIRQGAEQFEDQRPDSIWHGRRQVWRGYRCADPYCDQCCRNEISKDYSGRDHI
jgi:hypothetical protein